MILKTAIGPQAGIYYDELPESLTSKDAQRNGVLMAHMIVPEDDTRSDSNLLDQVTAKLRARK